MTKKINKVQEANHVYRLDPITEKLYEPVMTIEFDGHDLFVKLDGVKVAKRGQPGSAEAGALDIARAGDICE